MAVKVIEKINIYLHVSLLRIDELDEQTLSVVIDSEESTLEFIDFTKHQVSKLFTFPIQLI